MDCHTNLITDDTLSEAVCSCQATASAVEEKLALSQSELQQVKASIKQYESLLDSYKIQVCEAYCTTRDATDCDSKTDSLNVRVESEPSFPLC